jgi:hypothetical protein
MYNHAGRNGKTEILVGSVYPDFIVALVRADMATKQAEYARTRPPTHEAVITVGAGAADTTNTAIAADGSARQ